MNEPFTDFTRADWVMYDHNAHMRNSAFLDVSVACRMRHFEASESPVSEFAIRQIGPVVGWERLD